VACRTSDDLVHWSDRQIVYTDYHQGTGYGPTESPFIVRRGDFYYLFIGPRPYDHPTDSLENWEHPGYVGTDVFRSEHRDLWTNADFVGHIAAHAPEIVRDADGDWFVSHAGILQGGLYLTSLTWLDSLDSGVSDEDLVVRPQMHLTQNYPNPFNPETTIVYHLPERARIQMIIYDVLGRKIRVLLNGIQQAGHHAIQWNGCDNAGFVVPSGIYICRIVDERNLHSIKLTVLR